MIAGSKPAHLIKTYFAGGRVGARSDGTQPKGTDGMLKDRSEAYQLLNEIGAPERLLHHAQLVSEAADLLLIEFRALGLACDVRLIELGAIIHDAGKVRHPQELSHLGSEHEKAGESLLLSYGVQPEVARCCTTYGAWDSPGVSLEERVVALADKLWKGKRDAALELNVIDEIAVRLRVTRWDIFERLDSAFEEIAAAGAERIQQSRPD